MSLSGHNHLLAPPDGQSLELQLSSMELIEGQVYRGEILAQIPKQGRIFLLSCSQVCFFLKYNKLRSAESGHQGGAPVEHSAQV